MRLVFGCPLGKNSAIIKQTNKQTNKTISNNSNNNAEHDHTTNDNKSLRSIIEKRNETKDWTNWGQIKEFSNGVGRVSFSEKVWRGKF